MCRVEVWENICSTLRQANRGRGRYSFSVEHVNVVKNILG